MQGYGYLYIVDYAVSMTGTGSLTIAIPQQASVTMSGEGSLSAFATSNYGYSTLPRLSAFGGYYTAYGAGDSTLPALESYAEGGLYVPTVTNYGFSMLPPMVSSGFLHTVSPITGDSTIPALGGIGCESEYGEGDSTLPALVGLAIHDMFPFDAPIYNRAIVLNGIAVAGDYIVFIDNSGTITSTIEGDRVLIDSVIASIEAGNTFSTLCSLLVGMDEPLRIDGGVVAAVGTAPALASADRVWVVNIDTAATSQYDDYGFNSFLDDNGDGMCYGLADDGVYELTGNTDAGATIPWQVDFGISNCGIKARKKILNVYVGVTTGGTTYLKVNVDGTDHTYRVERCVRGPYDYRAKIPHDIQGHQWGFTLMSSDDTDLIGVEFVPANLTRRI
jgi:hypothetical protein